MIHYDKLRKYQQEDVKKYLTTPTIFNFSEQRTGKTPTTCVALAMHKVNRIILVCPNSMVYAWEQEWKTWTELPTVIVDSTKFQYTNIPDQALVIMNYEKLRGSTKKDNDLLLRTIAWNPEAVVIDEAHRIKNRKSLTYLALKKLNFASIRIALTGTPAPNKPWDVWAILNWVRPATFKSYWKFIEEYFNESVIWVAGEPIREPSGFKKGMEEVLQDNLNILGVQHKRAEVMQWLPKDAIPKLIKLPPTSQQQKAIEALQTYFEYKHIITQGILDNLIRIRQICADPTILDLKGKSPKKEWVKQYLKDYPEEFVLIFSNSKKFLLKIATELTDAVLITGDISSAMRQHFVQKFQSGEVKVLLCQTQACKEGLTLDNADTTIFLDVYPPAADYAQAKDRMVATTPERNKPKKLIHVMMENTYDETIYTMVRQRKEETAIINDYKQLIERRRKHE